jgi:hydroxymethylpyrimidine/phosphomethylpyrimidine kinase
MKPISPPIALTIAGSDSGGGAGIQADLKTFCAFEVYGTSAITAVTAQNTVGVSSIHAVPVTAVRAQIDAVVTDLRPNAFKTGMLTTQELVCEVAKAIHEHRLDRYVMDPVMVATSGDRLLDSGAEASLANELLPLTTLITPNLHEAAILLDTPLSSLKDLRAASRSLVERGAGAALIKGGHLEGEAIDILWDGSEEHIWRRPKIKTTRTHGSGCTLSAAITAGLARSDDLVDAVDRAIRFVVRAIRTAPPLGEGNGPLNHFEDPA